jgi:hypothetical protein
MAVPLTSNRLYVIIQIIKGYIGLQAPTPSSQLIDHGSRSRQSSEKSKTQNKSTRRRKIYIYVAYLSLL